MPSIRDILLNIDGDPSGANRALDEVAAGLEGLDGQSAEAKVELARAQFDAQVAEVEARLEELSHETANPKVKLKYDTLRADAETAGRDATAAFERFFQPKYNQGTKSGILGDASALARDLAPALGMLEQVGQGAEQAGQDLAQTGFSMGELAGKTRDLQEVGQVLLVLIIAGLVPALAAMAGSLVAAVGGAGVLAVAFAGTLLPAVAGAIAVFSRFSAVLNVATELQNQARNATHNQATEDQRAAAAGAARHAALVAERNARQALTQAEHAYADAVKAAEKTIADARTREQTADENLAKARRNAQRAEDDAARRVVDAQHALKKATSDAYQHWKDLIDQVKDDQLSLEGAQLSVLDAQDALNKAQGDYNKLLNEIPSDKLGDVLKKLNDVNLPEDQVKAFIQSAMGADADPDFANKLYTSHLKLLHAQHDLKVATQGVIDATHQLSKDQKELNGYTEHGITVNEEYRSALEALKTARRDERRAIVDGNQAIADAAKKLKAARKELAIYVRDGVDGMSSVRNAAYNVRQAQQRLADAHYQVKHAADAARISTGNLGSATDRLKHDLAALSPAEREVLYALVGRDGKGGLKGAMRSAFGTDAVMSAFAGFLRGISRMLKILSPDLQSLSTVFAGVLSGLGKAATGNGAISFFKAMISAAKFLTAIGASVLSDFAGAFVNLAKAATPSLVGVMLQFAGAMRSFRDATASPGAGKTIGVMVDSFKTWAGFLKDVIVGFGKLAIAVAPFGDKVVKWLGKGAEDLGKWASSAKGSSAIKDFFASTLPLAESIGKALWQVLKFFLLFIQAVAPILKPFIDTFVDALKVVNFMLGIVNKIPAPIRGVAGTVAALLLTGGKLFDVLGKVPGILGDILKVIGGLSIVDTIKNALNDAVGGVDDAAKAVGNAILSAIKTVLSVDLHVADWVSGGLGDASALGTRVLKWIGDGISSAAGSVASAGGAVANWISSGLGAISGWGRDILNAIGTAVKGAINGASDIGASIGHWLIDGIGKALSVGSKILHWIGTDLKKVLNHAAGWGGHIGHWLIDGLGKALQIGGKILGWLRSTIGSALNRAGGFGKRIANWVTNGLRGALNIGGKLVSWLSRGISGIGRLGSRIANELWNGMKSLPGKILRGIKGAINDVIRGWNRLAFHIGGQSLGPLGHLPSITINTPDIPFLAQGGLATKATAAIFGEAGDEAVLPLTDEVFERLGAGLVRALSASTPRLSASPMAAARAMPASDSDSVARYSETHDHLHVHGHTAKVDPDPRTTMALQEARRRKKGGGRS